MTGAEGERWKGLYGEEGGYAHVNCVIKSRKGGKPTQYVVDIRKYSKYNKKYRNKYRNKYNNKNQEQVQEQIQEQVQGHLQAQVYEISRKTSTTIRTGTLITGTSTKRSTTTNTRTSIQKSTTYLYQKGTRTTTVPCTVPRILPV